MRELMRTSLLLFFITLYPSITSADNVEAQINKACLRHAVSLVAQLRTDVIANMNQEQSDKALKIATTSCQAYFSKEFAVSITAKTNTEETESKEEKKKDPFTDKWFESADKDGNKRLKRRQ